MQTVPQVGLQTAQSEFCLSFVKRWTSHGSGLASFETQTVIFSRGGRETKWRRREEMSVAEVRTACILIKISEHLSDLYFSKRVKSFCRTYQVFILVNESNHFGGPIRSLF